MGIEVAREATSIGTYRYSAFAAGRGTHGFRSTRGEATEAAREDEALLREAGRTSGTRDDDTNNKTKVRARPQRRRDHRPGD